MENMDLDQLKEAAGGLEIPEGMDMEQAKAFAVEKAKEMAMEKAKEKMGAPAMPKGAAMAGGMETVGAKP